MAESNLGHHALLLEYFQKDLEFEEKCQLPNYYLYQV